MISPGFSTRRHPVIIGHRGAAGHALENSADAFRLAADPAHVAHCDAVELDVHTTQDGEFVVHHDPVLPSGDVIADTPLSRVRASGLADGSPPPRLDDVLRLLSGIGVWIEVKSLPSGADAHLIETIRKPPGCCCGVHAFDHRVIARLRALDPVIPLGVLSRSYPVDPVRQVTDAGAGVLWQEAWLVDAGLVARCHATGIEVIAWTANDPDLIEQLAGLGVDGICSDWPERVRAVQRA